MRILQINATDTAGSTGTIMRDIQDMCTRNAIDCYLAYCGTQRNHKEIVNGYRIGCWFDHKLHALLSRIFRKQAYFSRFSTWAFLRHIDHIQPDIVHLHNLHNNYIHLPMLLRHLAKRNIPTVATLHDNWNYTGGCCYYPRSYCQQWQHDCSRCPEQQVGYKRFLPSTATSVLADRKRYFNAIPHLTLVGVSDWVANDCRHSVLGQNDIRTIRNGVRTDIFCPMPQEARQQLRQQYGIRPEQFLILGPASKWLDPRHRTGLKTILTHLCDDEVLVLYGCTPHQLKANSQWLIANTQQSKASSQQPILIPFITDKVRLATIYAMADVMINCTIEDTCSFLNIEAQACGTPIITFDNTGARETVNNICSFCIPSGDFHAFIRRIADIRSEISANSQWQETNSQACIHWIQQHFTMQQNYEHYIQLYKELYSCINYQSK